MYTSFFSFYTQQEKMNRVTNGVCMILAIILVLYLYCVNIRYRPTIMLISYMSTNFKTMFRSLHHDNIIQGKAIYSPPPRENANQVWICFHGLGGYANRFCEIRDKVCPKEVNAHVYFYEYPGHGFRYRTSNLGDMETWFLDITSLYYYLKSIYAKDTTFVFMGFSWGGYIAAAVASSLAITPSPVDYVLLVGPFSHYTDVGRMGRLFSSRTTTLLDGLSIPKHDKLHQWHVLFFSSDATINKHSKHKWGRLASVTVVEDQYHYDKKTHNQILWSKDYHDWVSKIFSATSLPE